MLLNGLPFDGVAKNQRESRVYGMKEMDVDWITGIEENRIENGMESTIKYIYHGMVLRDKWIIVIRRILLLILISWSKNIGNIKEYRLWNNY